MYWKSTKTVGDYIVDIEKNEIVKYIGSESDITVPDKVMLDGTEYVLTKIRDRSFYDNRNLEKVTISDGITSIGADAFLVCTNLKSINIPTKEQGDITGEPWGAPNAAVYWKNANVVDDFLIDINKGEILKYVGTKSNITVPSKVTIKGTDFNLTKIADNAFYGNQVINTVNISDGIISIGKDAFSLCGSLKNVTIPDSVTHIDSRAFSLCNNINISIPTKTRGSISGEPWGASSSNVYWKDTTIVDGFLVDINKGEILKYLGIEVDITIPSKVKIKGVEYNLTKIADRAFYQEYNFRKVVISEGIKSIGKSAFDYSNVENIFIPDSIEEIGDRAFNFSQYWGTNNGKPTVHIPTKNRGEIAGEPWTASNIMIPIIWKDTKIVDDFLLDINKGEIVCYIGNKSDLTIPSKFMIEGNEHNFTKIGPWAFMTIPSKNVKVSSGITSIGHDAFDESEFIENLILPDSITEIGDNAFNYCTSLKNITLPKQLTKIPDSMLGNCISLTSVTLPDNVKHIGHNVFLGAPLKTIKIPATVTYMDEGALNACDELELIVVNQERSSSSIATNAPWGSLGNPKVLFKNEYIYMNFKTEKIPDKYERKISYSVSSDSNVLINTITTPDNNTSSVGKTTTDGTYTVTKNGTYTFKCTNAAGVEFEYKVVIDDIGKPIISAENAIIDLSEVNALTVNDLLKIVKASAKDECGKNIDCKISEQDVNYVKALKSGADTWITVTATNTEHGTSAEKQVMVTGKLPDIVPGSKEKPAGYVTVAFAKGEHGKLEGETSQHVNPTKVVDLKTLAPKVTADTGFKHTGWDKALKAKFDKDTTITATYDALPDTVPGSQEKPAGYVTVTFAKGEHGKLTGETSQHVNPTKVVDLTTLAPKVAADTGFKHTGWDKALKAKFDKDTTITATYDALPDTVPGSQEKPAGYVTVTFAKGEHGSLSGELSQHVNPTKVVDLKTLAPKVTADTGFKHTGWNSELKKKFTEDTIITATYDALPDAVPGSQEKPAGYVTVTFAKGEHGKLTGETSQHVNPTKEVDLKTLAPKVTADTGFKHTGWNGELKKKFTEDTTITATYEVATEKCAITIDPDGGTWNGSTDPIVYNIEKGEYITLPDAPTKEGYTFKYWKGSKYMPGDKYKVEGEHKFTAVWEKKATSKTDDSSTGTTGTSETAGSNGANTHKTSTSNHAPLTADTQNILLYLMMSIFSFAIILRLRGQEN